MWCCLDLAMVTERYTQYSRLMVWDVGRRERKSGGGGWGGGGGGAGCS